MKATCTYCKNTFDKSVGHYNRAEKMGMNHYCSKKCVGKSRRTTKVEKIEVKRLYDISYRKKNANKIKSRMKDYNSSPAGREMQKRARQKRIDSGYHLDYCRTPDQKQKTYIRDQNRKLLQIHGGKEWKYVDCLECDENKPLHEFMARRSQNERSWICDVCEDKFKNLGISTHDAIQYYKVTASKWVGRLLKYDEVVQDPYLIEANRYKILIFRNT